MEAQIENAIEIAFSQAADQALKAQAFDFVSNLRSDPQSWQAFLALFTRTPRASEVVRVVSLDLLNNAIHSQTIGPQDLPFVKQALLGYIDREYGEAVNGEPADPGHMQNKLAQSLTYLFVLMYGNGWESFIDDFLALAQRSSLAGVFLYLRILGSIHDEIADMMVTRQGDDAKRNSDLKDLLRERDVQKIAVSWQSILTRFSNNDAVLELTLKLIGKWVSWIDINLVVNQEMLSQVLPIIGRVHSPSERVEDTVRDAAINTLTEIVSKKMKPADKVELISILNLREIVLQLLESPPLREFKGTHRYDTDLAETVAKLVNTVMTDTVRVLEDNKVDNETRAKAEQLLGDFMPPLLHLFSDEYDEVCSTTIPSLTDLLTFLRKVGTLPPAYSQVLPPILNAIVAKMRYDETTTWASEDAQTDEAEFQELRKRLQNLQKSVAAVDQNLYIEFLTNLAANMFATLEQQGSAMDWRDLDLALHEIYLFGELALPNAGLAHKSQPNSIAMERLAGMMSRMVESGIANFPHPAILLQYMEICVRYYMFFENQQRYIPQVLENFVQLVHHNHVRVRTRSWYLFLRFVKQLRAQVGNVAKTVIESISDLLPIKAEVPSADADDDMSSDESDHSADAVFNGQLYLFEAIGCISSTSATPAADQALYARSVIEPLFADIGAHLQRAKAGDAQAVLQVHHIIMALGTLANGFADVTTNQVHQGQQRPQPAEPVSAEFSRAAEAILLALNELNSSDEIRAACRSAFARLLNVLGPAVLPQLPQWIEGLLSRSSRKDEMALFLRLLEQVVFNFKGEIYSILDVLLTPLLSRVFAGLAEPVSGTDDEIQLGELRREFVSFVQVILVNDLGGVLVSETNQGTFDPLVTRIIEIATTLLQVNLVSSRISFNVLGKMCSVWGGPDVATVGQNPATTGAPTPAIPGFDSFMMQRFHAACWDVLVQESFKPFSDAQARQTLNEIVGVQQVIYKKVGEAFVQSVMRGEGVSRIGANGEDYLRALCSSEDKKGAVSYLSGVLRSRAGSRR